MTRIVRRFRSDRNSVAVHATAALLVSAPLLRPGYLLLLDFVYGPNVTVRWQQAADIQGPVNQAPFQAFLWLLQWIEPGGSFLFVWMVVFGLGYGMNRAIRRLAPAAGTGAAIVGGILYAINPFAYTRLVHGHVGLLAGMAVFPLVVIALHHVKQHPAKRTAVLLGASVAVAGFVSIHVAGMLVILIPAVVLAIGWPGRRAAAVAGLTTLALSSWWLAQWILADPPPFTGSDLNAFATVPQGFTSAGHTAALYGFWRVGEFALPRDGVWAWPLTFAPIAVAVLWGAVLWFKARRRVAIAMSALAVLGILLAAGTSFPPTAGIFRWLYETVPGFTVFREPQKWVAVVVFAYAILMAPAVDRLIRFASPEPRIAGRVPFERATVVVACLAVIGFYGRTMILNFDVLRPVRFPADWHAVNDTMRESPSRALVFPWHLYISFTWTGNRIANPADTFFDVPVVSSDSIEVGTIRTQSRNPESHAVERILFEEGKRDELPNLLASLCTRWVVLYKAADWESYAWLDSSPALTRAFDGPTIRLYRASIPRCT